MIKDNHQHLVRSPAAPHVDQVIIPTCVRVTVINITDLDPSPGYVDLGTEYRRDLNHIKKDYSDGYQQQHSYSRH